MILRVFTAVLFLLSAVASAEYKYYEDPTPEDFLVDIGTPPACDFVIDSTADWAQINNAAYNVFCVAPGDYIAAGTITITADGTAGTRKWLRYYNAGVGNDVHPYFMAEAQRAIIDKLVFNNANYWIVDRLTIERTYSTANNYSAIYVPYSQHVVFNQLYMYDFSNGVYFDYGASYNTVQNSVFQNMSDGFDGVAMALRQSSVAATASYNKFISNECANTSDCFQSVALPENFNTANEETFPGTIVYDNDMWNDTQFRRNCSTGAYDEGGYCSCKENGLDIKAGTTDSANPMILAHNRIWGFRDTPTGTNPCTSISANGEGVTVHFGIRNLKMEGNIIWDNALGIVTGNSYYATTITGNLFGPQLADGGYSGESLYLNGYLESSFEISGNVIVDNDDPYDVIYAATDFLTSSNIEFSTNTLINSDGTISWATFAGTVADNEYYGATVPSWDTSPAVNVASVVGTDWDNQFCTTIKRITDPTEMCFDYALYQTESPTITVPTQFRILD